MRRHKQPESTEAHFKYRLESTLDLPFSCKLVKALWVPCLTHLKWHIHEHLSKVRFGNFQPASVKVSSFTPMQSLQETTTLSAAYLNEISFWQHWTAGISIFSVRRDQTSNANNTSISKKLCYLSWKHKIVNCKKRLKNYWRKRCIERTKTLPILRMFSTRSSALKLRSRFSPCRQLSPSRM